MNRALRVFESVGVEGCRFAEGFQGDMGIAG